MCHDERREGVHVREACGLSDRMLRAPHRRERQSRGPLRMQAERRQRVRLLLRGLDDMRRQLLLRRRHQRQPVLCVAVCQQHAVRRCKVQHVRLFAFVVLGSVRVRPVRGRS